MKLDKKSVITAGICGIMGFLGDYTQQLAMGIRSDPDIFLCALSGAITGGIAYIIFQKFKHK